MNEIIIKPEGDLNYDYVEKHREIYMKDIQMNLRVKGSLIIDLANVNKLTASALSMFLKLKKITLEKSAEIQIINANKPCYIILEDMKFLDGFNVNK